MAAFDYEKASDAIAQSYYLSDAAIILERYGISDRTLRRWKARVFEDPKLAALVRRKKDLLRDTWEQKSKDVLMFALDKMRQLISECDKPEFLPQVVGAYKIVGEIQIANTFLTDDDDELAADFESQTPKATEAGTTSSHS